MEKSVQYGAVADFVLSRDFSAELAGGSILRMDGGAENLATGCSGGSRLELSKNLLKAILRAMGK